MGGRGEWQITDAIIERNATRLNREAQDTLEYQRTP